MATRILTRSLLTAKPALPSILTRSYSLLSLSTPPSSLSLSSLSLFRLRPLVAVIGSLRQDSLAAATSSVRGFATRQTTSSLNDSSPNWSNRPPKETILLDGCDFEHWLVVMEKPEGDPTRDEIIDSYIKTLAMVIGSEEEARMKIYSVSTRCYWAFGALVSEELSYKIKELPRVRWVLPDSYLDVRNKDYGGEPFINGEAVPYDPKYHEEWIRNNNRANDRNRRNDRPRNFDRSRNFERRRENVQNRGPMNVQPMHNPAPGMGGVPPSNTGGAPNMGPQQGNMGVPSNMGPGMQQGNMGGPSNMGPGMQHSNMGGPSNVGGGMQQHGNMGMSPNMQPPNNAGGPPPNYMGGPPNSAPGFQQSGPNNGGMPYQPGPGPNRQYQNSYAPNGPGGNPGYAPNGPGGNPGYAPNGPGGNPGYSPNGPGGNPGYSPNGPGGNPGYSPNGPGGNPSYAPNRPGGNPYQTQDMLGRDMPLPPNY